MRKSRRKPKDYLGQVREALGFEEKLQATLIEVFRRHNKFYFKYQHNDTGKLWSTTLSKLQNYGHNKFSRLNKGSIVGKCKTQEEVLLEFVEVHGDVYDYSKVVYINTGTKVEIICKEHGSFWQSPNSHKQGHKCADCSDRRRHKLEETLIDFTTTHGDSYDYSDVIYINARTKIEIICPTHGMFLQRPDAHKAGQGCRKCYETNKAGAWSYTDWEKAGNISKNFSGFKVYIIRCYNEEESFLKIGKTYTSIKTRFNGKQLPYSYEVLKVFEGKALEMSELEVSLQNLNKEFKYLTKLDFAGKYECFSELKEETFADNK